jgi:diaminohydroxyphosphoribosylaminopyrimidine deaminase / 5-amino-6-(5-phosphoribosylamino)uracil reductase
MSNLIQNAMKLAVEKAKAYEGATAPNPPVGATGLDIHGEVLSVQAHEKAGTPHAEVKVIEDCKKRGMLDRLHTLVVTLEPCNHVGKTGPCTEAIIQSPVQRIFYGAKDPNPKVQGAGASMLVKAGLEVHTVPDSQKECEELIRPFAHWVVTGRPWITVKTAFDEKGSMIPPQGQKTFTSETSLVLAHQLRKKSDAILTGSGTIMADLPEFTVRKTPDHSEKMRWLVYMDRRGRVTEDWINLSKTRGFKPYRGTDLEQAIEFLGSQGVVETLVEAGPTLVASILESGLWNEQVRITKSNSKNTADHVEVVYKDTV